MKKALITGITGQDGAYRRTNSANFWRIKDLGIDQHPNLRLAEYDLTDQAASIRLVAAIQPDENDNLAEQGEGRTPVGFNSSTLHII